MLATTWRNLVAQWIRTRGAAARPATGRRPQRPFGSPRLSNFRWRAETLETRVLLSGDALEGNNTWQTASDLGVIPGVHLGALSIDQATDQDWYRFDLLRTDDLSFQIDFNSSLGALSFDLVRVIGGAPTVLASSSANASGARLNATGLAAGPYYLHVTGGGNTNAYALGVDPSATSSTRVLYVNDAATTND
ncbi:MAG: LEPR-XLL domain-containing protein [Planctomycetaceae bacterium]